MTQNVQELTFRAIPRLLQQDSDEEPFIVQVFDLKSSKSGRVTSIISDGSYFIKAFFVDDKVIKPDKDNNAIIKIKSHGALKNSIGVTNFEFICSYPERVGSPEDWMKIKETNGQMVTPKHYKLQISRPSQKKTNILKETTKADKMSNYQTINDLHVGLQRWTILCRLTRKTLKESLKKSMKVLEIQLIDKSKTKILGTFFNEAATLFNDYLSENSIYEISKGRIKEENYNNSKNDKFSPYTLIFDARSTFKEVSDVNLIAKSEDTAITLGEVFDRKVLHQAYDVIAFVAEVKEETTIQKNQKTLRLQELTLADPERKITMNARLWNWFQGSTSYLNRILIFNRFILSEYKGSISLTSTSNASITEIHGHYYKQYENLKFNINEFTATTTTREREENTEDMCKNIKELQDKIVNLSEGDSIKSMLNVWVNRMAVHRKWSYDACPKCKKAAENHSKCQNENCQYLIEQTNPSFMMGVEVSDPYGSIWVTAYDEFGKKIFHDMNGQIVTQLQALSMDELRDKFQNYVYQSFKMKVLTKKDQEGRIRHNVNYLYEINEERGAKDSISSIKEMLGRM